MDDFASEGQPIEDLTGLLGGDPAASGEPGEPAGEEGQAHADQHTDSHEEPADEQDTGNGEEPTDPDESEEQPEGDEGREEAENDEGTPEPLYPVKIGDKEERVTLKEALAGYQRNADYTRKTQALADERKAVDATAGELRGHRDQYAQVLQELQKRIGPAEGERTEAQWAELRQSDPAAYAVEHADFQRRQEARKTIKAEEDRVAAEKQRDQVEQLKTVIADQRAKLVEKLPVLKDPVKGPKALQAIRDYAIGSAGFTEQEANAAFDHRILVMADKARQWDAHQAALKAANDKLRGARQVSEPSARQPLRNPKVTQRAAAMKKLDKSGRIDDAVDLI